MNVVIQSKILLEDFRNKTREKQARDTFSVISNIENSLVSNAQQEDKSNFFTDNLMRTKNFGVLNRFSNN